MNYAFTSHTNHIFQIRNWELRGWKNYWKMASCIITNTRKEMLVLVDFQNNYYSINYGISRVAIWNVTTK